MKESVVILGFTILVRQPILISKNFTLFEELLKYCVFPLSTI